MQRISSPNITSLAPNEIFVFGDNEAHIHGAGAARFALRFGAKNGQGKLCGQTYGIPTKSRSLEVLSPDRIQKHVDTFIECASSRPDLTFLVTEIGCGLAGYKPKDMAPLFKKCINMQNVHLPLSFINIINKT